ncbi:hypothetical protein N431DRAFT_459586 [Stipitochalara longipes BDJ]|nr:hypothetical protein N431DRAFT_459586 [Stipitochalara longipes BDJ]
MTVYQKVLLDMDDAWNYAESCYVDYTVPVGCMMPTQAIAATEDQNATCPFPGLCIFSDTAALGVDSGLINSNSIFGITAKSFNQVNYHRATTCAPLNTTGYKVLVNATKDYKFPLGHLIADYEFGSNEEVDIGNVTFAYDTDSAPPFYEGYQIYSPINDPIYSAHHATTGSNNNTYYTSDDYVTVLGCMDQHEYCLPDTTDVQGDPFCTGLLAYDDAWRRLDWLWINRR